MNLKIQLQFVPGVRLFDQPCPFLKDQLKGFAESGLEICVDPRRDFLLQAFLPSGRLMVQRLLCKSRLPVGDTVQFFFDRSLFDLFVHHSLSHFPTIHFYSIFAV